MLTSELKQNIFVTIYLLLLHNWTVILFSFGLIVSLGWLIYRPRREYVLFFIGFGLLIFGFEYNKHIADGLIEQTTNSLITITRHYKLEWLIRIGLSKILPLFFYFLGVLSILGGVLIIRKDKSLHQTTNSSK
jgi:hypothetical protein